MSDILTDIFNLVESYTPEAPHDRALEEKLLATMSPEQVQLFEAYQESEFHREEADRRSLFLCLVTHSLGDTRRP